MIALKTVFARSLAVFIAVVGALALSGCGTVNHDVSFIPGYAPPAKANVVVGNFIDAVPKTNRDNEFKNFDIAKEMREQLEAKLRESGLNAGPGGGQGSLVISGKIVDYEPGDAFKRWLMPGYGSTVLAVECALQDGDRKVATVSARRTVDAGGGYTIGGWKAIFGNVADDIVLDLKQKLR